MQESWLISYKKNKTNIYKTQKTTLKKNTYNSCSEPKPSTVSET